MRLRPVWWRRLPVVVRDGVPALALLAFALMPPLAKYTTGVGELPLRPFDTLALVAVVLQCLPLAIRRIWPAACLLIVEVGFGIQQLGGYSTPASQAMLVALYSAGAYAVARRSLAIAATIVYIGLSIGLAALGSNEGVFGFTSFYVVLCATWAAGAWVRHQRLTEAERRDRAAAEALADERARIASELHDVVTHHVTAMVVQADAAKYLLASAPQEVGASLDAVTGTGRLALSELRHLLGALNPAPASADRQPVARNLRDLVEHTRAAGQPVELVESGVPRAVSGGPELAAYRLVQESLTNALKHAPGRPTRIEVHYSASTIDITATTGTPDRAPSVQGSGRGLAGLRERLALFGGELTTTMQNGHFVVHGRIPVGGDS